MKKRSKRSSGIVDALKVLALIVTPVAVLVIAASKYPTMIERRLEQNRKSREVAVPAPAKAVTIEVISPDGKSYPELERAVTNPGARNLDSTVQVRDGEAVENPRSR